MQSNSQLIIDYIARNPGCQASDIRLYINKDPKYMSSMMSSLRRRELVIHIGDPRSRDSQYYPQGYDFSRPENRETLKNNTPYNVPNPGPMHNGYMRQCN